MAGMTRRPCGSPTWTPWREPRLLRPPGAAQWPRPTGKGAAIELNCVSGSAAGRARSHLLADQRAERGADDGAGGAFAAAVDLAAEQRAGGGADDQAGRTVFLAAVGPAGVATPPLGVAIDRLRA